MSQFDLLEGFTFDRRMGYGSKHDEESIHFDLCASCLDLVIDEVITKSVVPVAVIDKAS